MLATALCLGPTASAAAESLSDQEPHYFQIRTTDRRIAAALERGLRASSTFRELVDYVNTSNVVVYVAVDPSPLAPGIDGCLTFVSATGGFRYVVVHLASGLTMPRLVSLIGHELQHAREIADCDAIVDSASLAREYGERLGYHNRFVSDDGHTFDSAAAVRAGEQVLKEVLAE